ncbi:dienelactone hydrolase family protein [Flagellimonas crocea]|uniref:hypothetical protein n=1 Tax=Flagellimonas crocea TaxID=3067311 RepID=UPI00296EED71|nr:hypothetical protein [Muricauda sp. DH64]
MRVYSKIMEKLSLMLFFTTLIICLSCSKDEDGSFGNGLEEIKLSLNTKDTIIHVTVDNYKIPIYLSLPSNCDNQTYPAVVVMHGSGGMWSDDDPDTKKMSSQSRDWQEIFENNCIVAAFVDSYSGRGVKERTGKWTSAPDNFRISSQFVRPKDANIALEVLKGLKFSDGKSVVRPQDIGILGFSDGASALAATLYDTSNTPADWEWTQSFDGKDYDFSSGVLPPQPKPKNGFAGGVFYYGGSSGYGYWGTGPCNEDASKENIYQPYAPILYQLPSKGYLTENNLCMVDLLKEKGIPVELNIYDGVGHGFDTDDNSQSSLARTKTIIWFKTLLHINE